MTPSEITIDKDEIGFIANRKNVLEETTATLSAQVKRPLERV